MLTLPASSRPRREGSERERMGEGCSPKQDKCNPYSPPVYVLAGERAVNRQPGL